MSARNLLETFVVMQPRHEATPVEVTPDIYQRLDRDFRGFRDCSLVARYDFDRDWPTWEIHPNGDEIVVLLSGVAEMILDEPGGRRSVVLSRAGEFVIVARGTWHTAHMSTPTSMLFVTPGEGTQNRPA
jgi:mannose-6-phosphate isomerase-like protein (cupin superfamily)